MVSKEDEELDLKYLDEIDSILSELFTPENAREWWNTENRSLGMSPWRFVMKSEYGIPGTMLYVLNKLKAVGR